MKRLVKGSEYQNVPTVLFVTNNFAATHLQAWSLGLNGSGNIYTNPLLLKPVRHRIQN